MRHLLFILLIIFQFQFCLEAQKSSLDMNSPNAGFFGLVLGFLNSSVSCSGDSYCIIFATPVPNGNLAQFDTSGGQNGISGGDAKCQSGAANAGMNTTYTYKAIMALAETRTPPFQTSPGIYTPGINWVLYPDKEYRRPDNTLIKKTDSNSLFIFPLDNSIIVDSNIYSLTGLSVNVSTITTWNTSPNNCSDWMSTNGGISVNYGIGNSATVNSFSGSGAGATCSDSTSSVIYCAQQ